VRLHYHQIKEFENSFTSKYHDWELFYSIEGISAGTATKIESHIKRMKSRKYIEDLKKYPEMAQKLIARYS
jgi:putative endonuclease